MKTTATTTATKPLPPLSTLTKTQQPQQRRRILLDAQLSKLGLDAVALYEQAVGVVQPQSAADDDGIFGQSAIRAYRSFIRPKTIPTNTNNNDDDNDEVRLTGMALRTAQHIDFLRKRHLSHQQEWVRHHDGVVGNNNPDNNDGDQRQEEQERKVFPVMLLLDNLRSAFNVGSILRTADATACAQVLTTGITPHPFGHGHAKVCKSSLGAEKIVPTRHFATTRQAIEYIRQEHASYQILGLETTARSTCYTDYTYNREKGVVLVLGNEVTGVDVDVMPLLDDLLEIPMLGSKNSLNVASCAPIVLYEIVRQWNGAK